MWLSTFKVSEAMMRLSYLTALCLGVNYLIAAETSTSYMLLKERLRYSYFCWDLGRTNSPISARRGDGLEFIRIWATPPNRLVFWDGTRVLQLVSERVCGVD